MVQDVRCRVLGAGCRVQGVGCRVCSVGCRVYGVGCRVYGVGVRCRVWGAWCRVFIGAHPRSVACGIPEKAAEVLRSGFRLEGSGVGFQV